MICTNCNQPEGIAQRIGNDGLCESCRLERAREACASKRRCASCGAPEETKDGIIVLDENDVCEACQDAHTWGQAIALEEWRIFDFAHSLTH